MKGDLTSIEYTKKLMDHDKEAQKQWKVKVSHNVYFLSSVVVFFCGSVLSLLSQLEHVQR